MLDPYMTEGRPPRLHTTEGDAAGEIIRHAAELAADLIVMGTHGRGGFDRFTLGSVAEKVLRKAPCPVLTLPPGATRRAVVEYRSILCPVDFSPSSERSVEFALSLARNGQATVTVLHVIETVDEDVDGRPHATEAEALHSLVATRVQPSDRVTELLAIGKPHREILQVANDCRADLIVIGVRGRGPVDLTLFGSTTNQVVRRAACPVLTVRSGGDGS